MHKYICERCKQEKKCNILGCRKDCVKVCVKCMRDKQDREMERSFRIFGVSVAQ